MRTRQFGRILIALLLSAGLYTEANAQDYYQRSYPVAPGMIAAPYNYIYYPSQQVYFAPSSRMWFWNDGYAWRSNYRLPVNFRIDFRLGGIPITLATPYPYREHTYVENYYGRIWRQDRHFYRNEDQRRNWDMRGDYQANRRYEREYNYQRGQEGHGEHREREHDRHEHWHQNQW